MAGWLNSDFCEMQRGALALLNTKYGSLTQDKRREIADEAMAGVTTKYTDPSSVGNKAATAAQFAMNIARNEVRKRTRRTRLASKPSKPAARLLAGDIDAAIRRGAIDNLGKVIDRPLSMNDVHFFTIAGKAEPSYDNEVELEAFELYKRLLLTIREASKFVQTHRSGPEWSGLTTGGWYAGQLADVVRCVIDPALAQHPRCLNPPEKFEPSVAFSSRTAIAMNMAKPGSMVHQDYVPTDRVLALISLVAGNRPDSISVGRPSFEDVVKKEIVAMRKARQRAEILARLSPCAPHK